MILLREAEKKEANELTGIAMRSKAYWGYSEEFMTACKQELRGNGNMICNKNSLYVIAEDNGVIAGFYALGNVSSANIDLDLLFVEPEYIGSGIGRTLIENAKQRAIRFGGRTLHIQGDPNAASFYYLAMGAELTGQRESASIPGRYLPVFSIKLIGKDTT